MCKRFSRLFYRKRSIWSARYRRSARLENLYWSTKMSNLETGSLLGCQYKTTFTSVSYLLALYYHAAGPSSLILSTNLPNPCPYTTFNPTTLSIKLSFRFPPFFIYSLKLETGIGFNRRSSVSLLSFICFPVWKYTLILVFMRIGVITADVGNFLVPFSCFAIHTTLRLLFTCLCYSSFSAWAFIDTSLVLHFIFSRGRTHPAYNIFI